MSEFSAWSTAYEDFLHRRHEQLMDTARIRRKALRWGAISAATALVVFAVALFLAAGTAQVAAILFAVANMVVAGTHWALVFRIDRDMERLGLIIEFSDACDEVARDVG